MLYTQAKNITLNNFHYFGNYELFMRNSDQEEFSKSQIPFYHAVKAFPRILCYLASMIEDSETRLHIAENIWEEHGNGKPSKFHINSFHDYLTSIAGPDYVLTSNPWIDEWISNWFKETDVLSLSCKLAAIEYLYAPISASLAKHIETLNLHNEQSHYGKHAILDWEHGKELFEIALKYDNSENKEKAFDLFYEAQKEFIDVFNGMILSTKKDILDISKDRISFFYLREDASISIKALNHLPAKEHKNVITICSGGESIMEYFALDESVEVAAIDMNEWQYDLFIDKNKKMKSIDNDTIDDLYQGKFERLFLSLRNRFSEKEQQHFIITGKINHVKLKFAIEDIFSRDNLSTIFTDNAVKYTKKDFAEHFFNVFIHDFKEGTFGKENIRNILAGVPFDYYSSRHLNLKNKKVFPIIEHINSGKVFDIINFNNGLNADIIDLSNIGDWIPHEELKDVILAAHKKLKNNGVIVMRKLLGDYNLKEMIESAGFKAYNKYDTSHFYEETVVGYKYE